MAVMSKASHRRRGVPFIVRAVAAAAPVVFASTPAAAVDYFWSGNTAGAGTGWTGSNWNFGSSTNAALPATSASDSLIFDNRNGTGAIVSPMSVQASRTIGSIRFDNVNTRLPATLNIDTNGSGTTARTLTVANGFSLVGTETTAATVEFRGSNGVLTIDLPNASTFDVAAGGLLRFNSQVVMSGAGSVQKTGAGILQMNGGVTYTGGTTVTGGILQVATSGDVSGDAIATSPVGTGTLTLGNGVTFRSTTSGGRTLQNNLSLSGNVTFGGAAPDTQTGSITFNFTDGTDALATTATAALTADATITTLSSTTIAHNVSGAFNLTKAGSSNLTLSGANTYTGNTLVNAGRIFAHSAGALGTIGGYTEVASGAEVSVNGAAFNFTTNEPFRIAGVGITGNEGAIHIQNSAAPTFSGPITLTDHARVHVTSTATGTFDNANAFTGTNVNLTLSGGAGGGNGGTISGAIALGTGGINKLQGGTWTLTGNNTFSGATTIDGGTILAAATSGQALGQTSAVVLNAGRLRLGQGHQVNDAAAVTFNSGDIETAGLSETLGVATLTADSVIDLGAGASVLAFADSSGATWTGTFLDVWNWTGTVDAGGGTDQLFFGSDLTGLTIEQLGKIRFFSDGGTTQLGTGATILGNGEVVPSAIPEPTSVATLGVAALGLLARRRRVP
jgi:autotransporter-associated beta strand protein